MVDLSAVKRGRTAAELAHPNGREAFAKKKGRRSPGGLRQTFSAS
jgi:hypothetical protein